MEWPVLQLADKDPQLCCFYLASLPPQVGIDISILNTAHESEALQNDAVLKCCTETGKWKVHQTGFYWCSLISEMTNVPQGALESVQYTAAFFFFTHCVWPKSETERLKTKFKEKKIRSATNGWHSTFILKYDVLKLNGFLLSSSSSTCYMAPVLCGISRITVTTVSSKVISLFLFFSKNYTWEIIELADLDYSFACLHR